MAKKQRKINSTYFDMLNWFYKRNEIYRLTPAQAFTMCCIMHLCNENYSNECTVNLTQLAFMVNQSVRRLRDNLETLVGHSYISLSQVCQKSYQILVKFGTNEGEFVKQDVDVVRNSGTKEKERKENETKEKADFEKNLKNEVETFSSFQSPVYEPDYPVLISDVIEQGKINLKLGRQVDERLTRELIDKAIGLGYRPIWTRKVCK